MARRSVPCRRGWPWSRVARATRGHTWRCRRDRLTNPMRMYASLGASWWLASGECRQDVRVREYRAVSKGQVFLDFSDYWINGSDPRAVEVFREQRLRG